MRLFASLDGTLGCPWMDTGRTFPWLGARPGCQSRQWGHGRPILFLRGNGTILPCLQLWWGTCHSYRGPLFSDEVGKTHSLAWCGCPVCISISSLLSWLASLSLKINSSLCCCKEEEVPWGILGVPLAHFPHLGLGSSSPFVVPFPTVAPAQHGGRCLILMPVLLLFSYRCFLSLLPQNVLIWRHKHRPAGPEVPHGEA